MAITAPTNANPVAVSMVVCTPAVLNMLPPIRLASTDPIVVMLKARLCAFAESLRATTSSA